MPVNGGIIGKVNTPRSSSASGVWGILDLFLARTQSTWPSAGGYTVIQTFTATSTWTCPTGVTEVEYLVVAGGGGGGSQYGSGGGAICANGPFTCDSANPIHGKPVNI